MGPLNSHSDEDLLASFGNGSYESFSVLLDRYRRPLFTFLLRSVGDRSHAEDLFQEVMLRVLQGLPHFRERAKFSTWMYRIARNLCVDESRRRVHRRHRSLDGARGEEVQESLLDRTPNDEPGPYRHAVGRDLRVRAEKALGALPREQREVFLLRQFQELSFAEIAEVVGAPENTVKSRMRYALERLQEALQDYEDYVPHPH